MAHYDHLLIRKGALAQAAFLEPAERPRQGNVAVKAPRQPLEFEMRLASGFFFLVALFGSGLAEAVTSCEAGTVLPDSPVLQPSSDYLDNSDGTVTHNKTGLMWKRCAEATTELWDGVTCNGTGNTYTWSAALIKAKDNGFAGYTDWRLPNKKELESIVETCGENPAINKSYFLSTPSEYFWSSTSYAYDPNGGWRVGFSNGIQNYQSKTLPFRVRLVRGGPVSDSFDLLNSDTTPDAFSFTAQNGVALSTLRTSNSITVAGINPSAVISVSGGAYAINGGAYTTLTGTVGNGNSVTLQQTSSASYGILTTTTLTIGGVSANFEVTTLIAPTPPSAPQNVAGTAGPKRISLVFGAPLSTGTLAGGGAATISSYNANCGSQNRSGSVSPIVVGGLQAGIPYTCTLSATNSAGLTGPTSNAAPVIPLDGSPNSSPWLLLLLD